MDYRLDAPQLLLDFLSYHETIKAHSQRTVDEYYLDMRNFFRYLKQNRDPTLADKRLDEIDVRDVDLPFIASITLTDISPISAVNACSTRIVKILTKV
mgnify:CR=1 FL=1